MKTIKELIVEIEGLITKDKKDINIHDKALDEASIIIDQYIKTYDFDLYANAHEKLLMVASADDTTEVQKNRLDELSEKITDFLSKG